VKKNYYEEIMKILITGSQGTLGQPLMKELRKRGHEVWGCDISHQKDEKYIRCDISEFRQIEKVLSKKFDFVYNLAAEFGRINGEEYYEKVWKTNVIGLRNILELQKKFGFKLIHTSSSEIYGDIKVDYLKEDIIPSYQENDYAISKWVNEMQCKNFTKRYGNEIMTIRLFNAYGPGEFYTPYRSVVCLFCYRALLDLPYTVFKDYHRVFMYIDDLIPTFANACEKFVSGEIINIGGEEYRSVEELNNIILKQLGKTDKFVTYLPQDKHNITNKRPDITKAKKLLNHNPSIPLEVGVERTLEWMKQVYK